jgi:hypothetical protein
MPLPFVWTAKVKSIESRYMKYGLQDEFNKIHRRVIVVIEDDIPHTRTLCFYLVFFKEIESRFPDGFNSVWSSPVALRRAMLE